MTASQRRILLPFTASQAKQEIAPGDLPKYGLLRDGDGMLYAIRMWLEPFGALVSPWGQYGDAYRCLYGFYIPQEDGGVHIRNAIWKTEDGWVPVPLMHSLIDISSDLNPLTTCSSLAEALCNLVAHSEALIDGLSGHERLALIERARKTAEQGLLELPRFRSRPIAGKHRTRLLSPPHGMNCDGERGLAPDWLPLEDIE